MAMISDDRKAMESAFMADYWSFRKVHGEPEHRNEYWEELINTADALVRKYNKDPYITGVMLVCVDDLDMRSNGNKSTDEWAIKLLNGFRIDKGLPKVVLEK